MKKAVVLVLFFALCWTGTNAQSFYNFRNSRDLIGSVGTGVTSYYGDLNNPGDIIDTRLNLNVGLQYFFTDRISGRVELTWFQLTGDDAESDDPGRTVRNLSFVSNNFELNAVGIIHAFPKGAKFYQRPLVNPYAFGGIGLLYFNPRADLNGETIALQPLQTEGTSYSRSTIVIPLGGGLKVKAGPFFNIALEAGYRVTFTDYLDDVSTTYVANSSFSDPIAAALADRGPEINIPLREPGSRRGNPDNNDAYFILNVKVEYFIPTSPLNRKTRLGNKRGKRPKVRRTRRR